VYQQRPEFAQYPYEQFRDRLRELRKKNTKKQNHASFDSKALAHDRRIYPKKEANEKGEPRWEGSDAERLLKLDFDNGKHINVNPKDLYASQKEYKEFSLEVFRKHVCQEEKTRKFIAHWKELAQKKKDKARKKANKK
jgi:hypothetical protein